MNKSIYSIAAIAALALLSVKPAGAVEENVKNYRGIRSLGQAEFKRERFHFSTKARSKT